MDFGDTSALGVAVVGVAGTLLSALLTQRAADRSGRRRQERVEEVSDRRRREQELRSCYVALNMAARQYLAALTDQLHALVREEDLQETWLRLTGARDQYREAYAEAQLRVPESVLDLAGRFSHDLGALYGMVRRLDGGPTRTGDSAVAVRENIDALWAALRRMRGEMRDQLGASRADFGR
ncbi:hypothetical protein GCM10009760_16190 [Kitasatospora kazusensis]|uniref:Secreted protein n=1 Tax=Kitasatospora kazusensis TaxID=407974 RepID=A0ABN2Z4C8_9ACTN